MENKPASNPENENAQAAAEEKDAQHPSVENGKKIMDIQKKLQGDTEEDNKKDADKWRNEG